MEEPELIKRRDLEVKEESKEELEIEKKPNDDKKEDKEKTSIVAVISRIMFVLVFLFLIAETVLGVLNLQKIDDDKEPIWCIKYETKDEDGKKEKICDIGFYVIVKTKKGNETKTSLKPFFLK